MSTTLHSFIDIFQASFPCGSETVSLQKIVIPLIQRDYAQGRTDDEAVRVRCRFLTALYDAVTDAPITLDFVYGDIDSTGTMTPLDGQQRLTTLFLLHWYAAKKEQIPASEYAFLKNFSYETRYSARYFCSDLVDFSPSFQKSISSEIVDQAWFPLDWQKDPTIHSMLVMLDAIDAQFKAVPHLWNRLKNGAITFYFLPIRDMGLTDELYIKMNSRGKPLTLFEHFKAELEREIRLVDERNGTALAERIIASIDRTWTDLLWRYRNGKSGDTDDNTIDDEFLRYFKFICDVLCYRSGKSPQSYSNDVFDLLHLYFSAQDPHTPENLAVLEAFFNCWCHINGYADPSAFLCSFMGHTHEAGKIVVDSKDKLDIFEDCIHSYSDKSGRLRHFPLNRIVLLYAVTMYLQHQDTVSYPEFVRRIRVVNNLIQNSEDEISDRLDRNRLPAILKAVDAIILSGAIDPSIDNSFNVNQLKEEQEKALFLAEHPALSETLFALEDHPMLRGQIGIVGLKNLALGQRFASLFTCSWDKIDCALMSVGNYGQQERNKWRYQYGSKSLQQAWHDLFHKSANTGFENTQAVLLRLLTASETFTDSTLDDLISSYISQCEKRNEYPWNYYYIKYPVFRPGSYGKLSNDNAAQTPYLFSVLQTKSYWSQNTYVPYLKEADDTHLSRDAMGQRLVYNDVYIVCHNDSYTVHRREDNTLAQTIPIAQNAAGIDTEDRIVKLKSYLRSAALA